MSINKKNIVLLGATGYTGRLIANLLDENEITVCLAGRSFEKIAELKKTLKLNHAILEVDVMNANQLEETLSDFEIIIDCIGPYNLFGKHVLDFCRGNGRVYIDISGEQYFIHESFLKNEETIRSGASIIHSVSFESALAEILAGEILDAPVSYKEISSYYFFDKSRPSPGTRLTMQLAKNFPTYYVDHGELKEAASIGFGENVFFDFAPNCKKALFMPYPEVLFFKKRFSVKKSATYLLVDDSAAMLLQASSKNQAQEVDAILTKHQKVNPQGPSAEQRTIQEFILAIKTISENDEAQVRHICGNDMYGITAFLVVKLVRNIINGLKISSGVLTPVEAGGWENVWDEMKQAGFITEKK
jgi:short subunit dehydrogenase-like uncharacterized protein